MKFDQDLCGTCIMNSSLGSVVPLAPLTMFILGDPSIVQYQAPRPILHGWSSPTLAWLRNSVDSTSSSRSTLAPKCFARQNTLMDSWREMLQSRFGLTRVIRSTSRRSLRISTMFQAPPLGSRSYKQSVCCHIFKIDFSSIVCITN